MSYNPFNLVNKRILVTGASSGIGKAAAIECSKLGAEIIATGRNEQRLQDTMRRLSGSGHQMFTYDLSILESVNQLVDSIPEIDCLVNNAGITITRPVQFINEHDFLNLLTINTIAPILLFKQLLKKKKLKNNSSVVFTSSLAALGKNAIGNSMYASSKGAISSFVKAIVPEVSKKGIRVNAVCPGMINTGILDAGTITKDQLELDMQNYPLKRYGRPEEVAWAIIYLLSDASSWTTGIDLVLDGGISVK